jgi:hypothetical protein
MKFVESSACKSRAHCHNCRGELAFRQMLVREGKADREDFDCPHGIPWNAPPQVTQKPQAPPRELLPLHPDNWPAWAKLVAAMKAPEDKGVGSTIDRKLGLLGAAFKLTLKALGVPCGCGDRKELYDRLYPYSGE